MKIIIYEADDATNHQIDVENIIDPKDCKIIAKIANAIEEYYEKQEFKEN